MPLRPNSSDDRPCDYRRWFFWLKKPSGESGLAAPWRCISPAVFSSGWVLYWAQSLLGGLLTGLFMMGYAKTYVQDVIIPQAEEAQTTLNTQAYDPSLSSNIYYWDDTSQSWQIMKTLYANENRVWITMTSCQSDQRHVAIEDKRFWEHNGVDWRRTLGAVYMFTGRDVQGGSTITQQLIKNLSQNDDVTVKRKVLEIFSALEFDSNHSKEEILELYLNNIYLGRQCNGKSMQRLSVLKGCL